MVPFALWAYKLFYAARLILKIEAEAKASLKERQVV